MRGARPAAGVDLAVRVAPEEPRGLARVLQRAEQFAGDATVATEIRQRIAMRREDWEQRQQGEGTVLVYHPAKGATLPLLQQPVPGNWDLWTSPTSLREVEAEVNLILDDTDASAGSAPAFRPAEQTQRRTLEATNEDDVGDVEPIALVEELAE